MSTEQGAILLDESESDDESTTLDRTHVPNRFSVSTLRRKMQTAKRTARQHARMMVESNRRSMGMKTVRAVQTDVSMKPMEGYDQAETDLWNELPMASKSISVDAAAELFKYHQLHVKVQYARGLVATNVEGSSNPYVRISVGDEIHSTRHCTGTVDPDWNETFTFSGKSVAEAGFVVVFESWSKDLMLQPDDFCGQAELDLRHVRMGSIRDRAVCKLKLYVLKASGKKEKHCYGDLYVTAWTTPYEEGRNILSPGGNVVASKDVMQKLLRGKQLPAVFHNVSGTMYEEPCIAFIRVAIHEVELPRDVVEARQFSLMRSQSAGFAQGAGSRSAGVKKGGRKKHMARSKSTPSDADFLYGEDEPRERMPASIIASARSNTEGYTKSAVNKAVTTGQKIRNKGRKYASAAAAATNPGRLSGDMDDDMDELVKHLYENSSDEDGGGDSHNEEKSDGLWVYVQVKYAKQMHQSKLRRVDPATLVAKFHQSFPFSETRPMSPKSPVKIHVFVTTNKNRVGTLAGKMSVCMLELLLTHQVADKAYEIELMSGVKPSERRFKHFINNPTVAPAFSLPLIEWQTSDKAAAKEQVLLKLHVGAADMDYRPQMYDCPLIPAPLVREVSQKLGLRVGEVFRRHALLAQEKVKEEEEEEDHEAKKNRLALKVIQRIAASGPPATEHLLDGEDKSLFFGTTLRSNTLATAEYIKERALDTQAGVDAPPRALGPLFEAASSAEDDSKREHQQLDRVHTQDSPVAVTNNGRTDPLPEEVKMNGHMDEEALNWSTVNSKAVVIEPPGVYMSTAGQANFKKSVSFLAPAQASEGSALSSQVTVGAAAWLGNGNGNGNGNVPTTCGAGCEPFGKSSSPFIQGIIAWLLQLLERIMYSFNEKVGSYKESLKTRRDVEGRVILEDDEDGEVVTRPLLEKRGTRRLKRCRAGRFEPSILNGIDMSHVNGIAAPGVTGQLVSPANTIATPRLVDLAPDASLQASMPDLGSLPQVPSTKVSDASSFVETKLSGKYQVKSQNLATATDAWVASTPQVSKASTLRQSKSSKRDMVDPNTLPPPPPATVLPLGSANLFYETLYMSMPGVYFFVVIKIGPQWVRTATRKSQDRSSPGWDIRLPVYEPSATYSAYIFYSRSPKPSGADLRLFSRAKFPLGSVPPNSIVVRDMKIKQPDSGLLGSSNHYVHLKMIVSIVYPDWGELALRYKMPERPTEWYTLNMDEHADYVEKQYRKIVVRWLENSTPSLPPPVTKTILRSVRDKFDLELLKLNGKRVYASISGIMSVAEGLQYVMSWQNPYHSVFTIVCIMLLCLIPSTAVSLWLTWLVLVCHGNREKAGRIPGQHAAGDGNTEADDDDIEPAQPGSKKLPVAALKRQYDEVMGVALMVQNLLDDIATFFERFNALLEWEDPVATMIFMLVIAVVAVLFYLFGMSVLLALAVAYVLRPPQFRDPEPTPPQAFFGRIPAARNKVMYDHTGGDKILEN